MKPDANAEADFGRHQGKYWICKGALDPLGWAGPGLLAWTACFFMLNTKQITIIIIMFFVVVVEKCEVQFVNQKMAWPGLAWPGLGWAWAAGLAWPRLPWAGLGLGWPGLAWAGSGWPVLV